MRLLRKILFLVMLILSIYTVAAQEFYKSVNPLKIEANSLNYKLTGSRYYPEFALKGPLYLEDEFQKGAIVLENGDSYIGIYLKLNTLTNELIWFNNRTGDILILDKYIIKEFILDYDKNNALLFRKIDYDNFPKGEYYFNVFYEGKLKLLLWYKTNELITQEYIDVGGLRRNTEYKMQTIFLIVFPDNNINKINGSKRSLVNLFPDQKKTVRRLLRKNKIDLLDKSPSEVARAVKLIETEFFSK